MKGMLKVAFILSILGSLLAPAYPLTIKLGSLAPPGSPWDRALKQISHEWANISQDQVELKVYSGGIAGDETDMIRKLRIGGLQAAAFSVVGLNQIDPNFLALALPLTVRSDDELEYLVEMMVPQLEERMKEEGYLLVNTSPIGWVYFFSRKPVISPDDLRKRKLWNWKWNQEEKSVWVDLGFRVVAVNVTDLLPFLQAGKIDSFASSPLFAAANQLFAVASHMTDMKWAPLLGGVVISYRTWNRVPGNLQAELLAAARRTLKDITAESLKMDQSSIDVMKRHGLQIHPVPDEVLEEWRKLAEKGFSRLSGKLFSAESYEVVKGYLAEYRKKHPAR